MELTPTESPFPMWLPFLLQTSDALFPTGAYAHSLGFEELVRLGVIRDSASLEAFFSDQLAPALCEQELPFLRFIFEAQSLDEICALDAEISAWKIPHETREASRQLGLRRLKALRAISAAPELLELEEAIFTRRCAGHHLTVFARQARLGLLPLEAALGVYFYQALAAACSAALKLIRIGQDAVQRLLSRAAAQTAEVVRDSQTIARRDAGWFNPLLEIASLRHARATERLFIS